MHIVLVGLNHRSAPLELRERLAFRREDLPEAFATLRSHLGLRETTILSTCNRVEIYAATPALDGTADRMHRFLSDHGRMAVSGLAPRLYTLTEPDSVYHLFAVASGLDSMVLGEGEILHQVKHAYEWARRHGATGKVLNVLFQRALNAAKAVRTRTAIGRGAASVGGVAVELSEKIFGTLSGATILLIGAGKIGEATLKRLVVRGVREVRIINRSPERAVDLAAAYRVTPVGWEALDQQLVEVDIVISSTSAPAYLLTRSHVADVMRARHQGPLCIVDLGVPRTIDPSIGTLENLYLFDVDDLQGLVRHSHREREQALQESHAILKERVERFLAWGRAEAQVLVGP